MNDSLLNRIIKNANSTRSISTSLNFSEPLYKNVNLDLIYNYKINQQDNELLTDKVNLQGSVNKIDSLSNNYSYSFLANKLNLLFRFKSTKLNSSIGSAIEATILNASTNGGNTVKQNLIEVSPVANVSYLYSQWSTVSLNYNAVTTSPNYFQLQPIRDTRNLENIIVGNPGLKPSFISTLNLNFHHITQNGNSFSWSLNGTTIQNKITTNTFLINDLLTKFRQETHFINVNGIHKIGSNYNFSFPFKYKTKKININLEGNITYGNDAYFTNSVKSDNESFQMSHAISFQLITKTNSSFSSISYNYTSNVFTNYLTAQPSVKTFQFNFSDKFFLNQGLIFNTTVNKIFNNGFINSLSSNPLIINASIEQRLFKRKLSSLQLQAFDLLNEGNNLNRAFANNAIIDTRNNLITRYFLIKLTVRLSKFGKQ